MYERYIRDYVIKAEIVDCFGLRYNVIVLAETRARFAHSSFLNHRLSDLQILHNKGLYDPMQQQLKHDNDELLLVNDKNFATVLITKYDSRGYVAPFLESGVIIYRVPKEELYALERENWYFIK